MLSSEPPSVRRSRPAVPESVECRDPEGTIAGAGRPVLHGTGIRAHPLRCRAKHDRCARQASAGGRRPPVTDRRPPVPGRDRGGRGAVRVAPSFRGDASGPAVRGWPTRRGRAAVRQPGRQCQCVLRGRDRRGDPRQTVDASESPGRRHSQLQPVPPHEQAAGRDRAGVGRPVPAHRHRGVGARRERCSARAGESGACRSRGRGCAPDPMAAVVRYDIGGCVRMCSRQSRRVWPTNWAWS